MKKFAAISLLLLLALHARADLTIVENLESGGQSQDITMKIKGDKARVDVGDNKISTIIDALTGNMVTLVHSQKMFVKISGDKAKAMLDQMKKMNGTAGATAEVPKIVDTGKKEKVGDYDAEVYTADTADTKCTFWITKGIADYASVQAQLKKMQTLQEKFGQGQTPDISKVDGVPVKTVVVKDGQTTTISLVSVKEDAVPDSELQPPADYTEMQLPAMPGAPSGDAGTAPAAPAPQQ